MCRASKTPSAGARIVAHTMAARHRTNLAAPRRETIGFMTNSLVIASPVRIRSLNVPSFNPGLDSIRAVVNDGSVHLMPQA
jgi:hypothetical protein